MRVLKYLIIWTVILTLFIGANIFIGREALLYMATDRLKDSLKEMQAVERKGHYVSECIAKGASLNGSHPEHKIQLRFTSNTEYEVEVVCDGSSLDPIYLGEGKLPFLVKKQPGQSGIIWGEELSGVKLELYGKEAAVYVENKEIVSTSGPNYLNFDPGPVASCVGYGFQCCQEDTQQGKGDQLTGVTDCPKTCFQSCLDRPVVLSFSSTPFFETGTRKVSIRAGQSISFNYLISEDYGSKGKLYTQEVEGNSNLLTEVAAFLKSVSQPDMSSIEDESTVVLDFGDGQQEVFQDYQGLVDHVYTCQWGNCNYQVVLTAKKGQLKSADTVLSKIEVLVN